MESEGNIQIEPKEEEFGKAKLQLTIIGFNITAKWNNLDADT